MQTKRALLALAIAAFGASAVAADQVTLTWHPETVDAQCRAAVVQSGNTYDGTFDITYSFGVSGAASGTIGSGVAISSGSFDAAVNYTLGPVWTFSACCISPTAQGGPKFRCCCSAPLVAVSPATVIAPENIYPDCPAGTNTTTPLATLEDGTEVFQNGPISYCAAPEAADDGADGDDCADETEEGDANESA